MSSRSLGALTLDLVIGLGKWTPGLDKGARQADTKFKAIKKSADQSARGIKDAFGGLNGILGGIGLGLSFGAIIEATSDAEKALANLTNAVKNNGGAVGFTTKELADFSGELQNVTTYSDDAIQNMQALLLRFKGISGVQFEGATQAVLDLAAGLDVDLQTAALQVGKALSDPEKGLTALQKAGVKFSDSQKKVIKDLIDTGDKAGAQSIILSELEKRFGGAATAARNNFGGALTGLKNAFGDLLEVKDGLPGVTGAINDLTKALSSDAAHSAASNFFSFIIEDAKVGIDRIKLLAEALEKIYTDRAKSPVFQGAKFLSDEFGLSSDQRGKIENDIKFLEEARDSFAPGVFVFGQQSFKPDSLIGVLSKDDIVVRLEELNKQLDVLNNKDVGKQFATGGPSRRRVFPSAVDDNETDTEAFDKAKESIDKLIQSQKQQVDVYGLSAEAAIRYRITQGDLKDEFAALGGEAGPLGDKLVALTAQYQALQDQAKQKEAVNSIKELVAGLQEEVDLMGASQSEILAYHLAHGDLAKQFDLAGSAADEYRQQLYGLTSQLELLKDVQAGIDESLSDFSAANEDDLEAFGKQLEEQFKVGEEKWTVFQDQLARNTQDIIADTLTNGFDDGLKGIYKSFADLIIKLTAQAVAADLTKRLFGDEKESGSGGGFGGLIGAALDYFTAKASGGPVSAGVPYLVGERGPEIVVPRGNGTVIPNGKGWGSSQMVNVNFTLPGGGQISRQTQEQGAVMVANGLAIARRRNG